MKAQIKNYLSLTKKDWNGIIVLLVLIALVLAAPYIYKRFSKDSTINLNEFNRAVAELNKANPHLNKAINGSQSIKLGLFKFNPNKLPAAEWQKLGLADKQITTIKNYEAHGGSFKKREDLKKIYGITYAEYSKLAPFMVIPVDNKTADKITVEVNTADSAKLTKVDGIGPAFARRIIYYRERLGGFAAKEQLKEISGLDDIKYREIKDQLTVDNRRVHKININTVSFDRLRLMPYLNYKQVNAIIEYRKQHGNYEGLADLKNIAILDDGILRKIEPYLIFND